MKTHFTTKKQSNKVEFFLCSFVSLLFSPLWQKCERDRRQNANKRRDMIPCGLHAEIQQRENNEHSQRNDFLDDLELIRRVNIAAPTIRRHLQDVFEKRDAPAHEDDNPNRFVFVLQM